MKDEKTEGLRVAAQGSPALKGRDITTVGLAKRNPRLKTAPETKALKERNKIMWNFQHGQPYPSRDTLSGFLPISILTCFVKPECNPQVNASSAIKALKGRNKRIWCFLRPTLPGPRHPAWLPPILVHFCFAELKSQPGFWSEPGALPSPVNVVIP